MTYDDENDTATDWDDHTRNSSSAYNTATSYESNEYDSGNFTDFTFTEGEDDEDDEFSLGEHNGLDELFTIIKYYNAPDVIRSDAEDYDDIDETDHDGENNETDRDDVIRSDAEDYNDTDCYTDERDHDDEDESDDDDDVRCNLSLADKVILDSIEKDLKDLEGMHENEKHSWLYHTFFPGDH